MSEPIAPHAAAAAAPLPHLKATARTPDQIIGRDLHVQLIFEGYDVVRSDEVLRLREIQRAARELADFIWKSVNVGPLTKAPHREARLWRELREAIDTEATKE